LESGSEIRVVLNGGKTIIGFLQNVSADSIAINAATSQEALSRQDVKLVSLKCPGHRGRNTVIGLLIGVGGGLATGAAIDRNNHGWFPNFGKDVFTPLGAIVGTVVGVALPTAVGGLFIARLESCGAAPKQMKRRCDISNRLVWRRKDGGRSSTCTAPTWSGRPAARRVPEASGGDAELRRELESLLLESADGVLDAPL
jgi:hypothetical protein